MYLLFMDWLILVGSFAVALRFRHYDQGMNIVSRHHLIPEMSMIMLYAVAMLGVFSTLELYKRKILLTTVQHFMRIIKVSLFTVLVYMLVKTLLKSTFFIPSRLVLLNWGILLFVGLTVHRLLVMRLLFALLSKMDMRRRVVMIGDTELARQFIEESRRNKNCGLTVVGIMDEIGKPRIVDSVPFIGCPSTLPDVVSLYNLEGAVICNPEFSHQKMMDLIER